MSKKSLYGLFIALIIPLICYLWLKSASDSAVTMPKHYAIDTVIESVVKGKIQTDTIWHTTKDIRLVNQLGDTVNLYDQKGKIIIIDLFFTSCGSICPKLTRNMSKLQQSFLRGGDTRKKVVDSSIVQFISISVDPDRDSVPVLREYANRMGVNSDNWWLLTGDRKAIYKFIFEELKIGLFTSTPIDPNFVHTGYFVVLDKNMRIRGFYDGLNSDSAVKDHPSSLSRLSTDVGYLMLEKDKKRKSEIFQQIIELSWLWLIIIVMVVGFVYYFTSTRQKY
jgi:protein SCO1/2